MTLVRPRRKLFARTTLDALAAIIESDDDYDSRSRRGHRGLLFPLLRPPGPEQVGQGSPAVPHQGTPQLLGTGQPVYVTLPAAPGDQPFGTDTAVSDVYARGRAPRASIHPGIRLRAGLPRRHQPVVQAAGTLRAHGHAHVPTPTVMTSPQTFNRLERGRAAPSLPRRFSDGLVDGKEQTIRISGHAAYVTGADENGVYINNRAAMIWRISPTRPAGSST